MEERKSNKGIYILILSLSVAIPAVVAILLLLPQTGKLGDFNVSLFPHINAVLNTLTAFCLLLGLFFIKQKRENMHRAMMISALLLSTTFLALYVLYHFQAPSTKFPEQGIIKILYLSLLITHIVLAAVVVPIVLLAFYYALSGNLAMHRRIVKFTFPVWLYVAVSGVAVYLMISPYYPG